MFNLSYKDQCDKTGTHRSGWRYVYENIKHLSSENSDTLLDLYVDETFHWNNDKYKAQNIIPYRKKWFGFVHHTFDQTFSDYNNINLLNNVDFIESLKTCKGILVLSKYLKKQFDTELKARNLKVPVYNLVHPTESVNNNFSMEKFICNNDKKLLSVGTWLRDLYSFYKLKVNTDIPLKKTTLTGLNGNTYLPHDNFKDILKTSILNNKQLLKNDTNDDMYCSNQGYCSNHYCSHHCSHHCSHQGHCSNDNRILNNWYNALLQDINNNIDSVDIIKFTNNQEFDDLLSKNIVYIKLVDASAVNTLIECVVRMTPIIVNKHPAIVEILGQDYPLFIDDHIINDLIEIDINTIRIAHHYLKDLDKTNLNIKLFIKKLTGTIIFEENYDIPYEPYFYE